MRRRLTLHQDQADDATVNLTPLIDVVFVVLIMFIIVAPMLELDRISLATAAAHEVKNSVAVQESSIIKIHVHEDNSIWFNSKPIAMEQLTSLLKTIKVKYPESIPQLFHDKRAAFGTYQMIKNAVEIAGFEELDIILQPN